MRGSALCSALSKRREGGFDSAAPGDLQQIEQSAERGGREIKAWSCLFGNDVAGRLNRKSFILKLIYSSNPVAFPFVWLFAWLFFCAYIIDTKISALLPTKALTHSQRAIDDKGDSRGC